MESVNAHLAPIRERRQKLAQAPARLMEIVRFGAEKAGKVAEETMVAARDAVGLLRMDAVESIAIKDEGANRLRVPESIAAAKTEEERWTIRTADWLERTSVTYPLKKDRARTFITRKGRKVGVYAAAESNGTWKFLLEDRPLNVLVLLAEDKDRFLHDYVLPPKILQDLWKKFPRTAEGVEIALKNVSNGSVITVAETDVPVQQYQGDYSALQ